MSSSRILLATVGGLLGATVLLPDLQGDVDALRTRVDLLEQRVASLERDGARPSSVDRPVHRTPREAAAAQVAALEARLGLEPDALELPARAWRAKVYEAAVQGYQFALQTASNEGLLRATELPELGSVESLRANAARLAEPALRAGSAADAYREIELGVQRALREWSGRRAGDREARTNALLLRWRSAGLSIVREKLVEGERWRDRLTDAADG